MKKETGMRTEGREAERVQERAVKGGGGETERRRARKGRTGQEKGRVRRRGPIIPLV
jgi:hypothetical protein